MIEDRTVSRRTFVATAAALAAGCASRGGGTGGAPGGGPLVHVGTYTVGTESKGVYVLRLDEATGALRPLGVYDAGPNPSFLAAHPGRRALYAVNETEDFGGERSGAVSSLAVDRGTGALALAPRGRTPSRGTSPCYISLDRTGRHALVANYGSGNVAVLPIRADGALGGPSSLVQHEGSGPNAARQRGPHAHCILLDPSNRFALAADLGTDHVMVYRFDPAAGRLTPAAVPAVPLAPGAGPRHLAFHPSGRLVFLVNELDLTIVAFRFDPATGALTPTATRRLAPNLVVGSHYPADVHVAPSGRFVYASVRGDDSIVVFAVDEASGGLTFVQREPTSGRWPRNFALDPSGRYLFAANQRSNDIVTFAVDGASGRISPTGHKVTVPAPACVRVFPG